MSDDEAVVLFASGAIAVVVWLIWFGRTLWIGRVSSSGRQLLLFVPFAAAALLFAVLRVLAAHDVRDDSRYLWLYFLLGAAWVGLCVRALPLLGVSPRDDVLERGNRAAADAVAGALLALTFCFAGGNIGDGPGWWVVVFSAGLATAALFLAWAILETSSAVSETVTIDRDRAAGIRLAGFLVACGVIFGRGAAGDWVSAELTVHDFAAVAWLAIPLLVVAAMVERSARPTASHPQPSSFAYGVVPAAGYLAAAALVVARLGLPE
jgi:uncharacterized membrane protein YjfL (UPF0719 family)